MEVVNVEENLNSELKKHMRGMKDGFVQVGEQKWFLPAKYKEVADEYKNFEVRPDDIWIMGYPRSGTTPIQNLVWELSHNLESDISKASIGTNEETRFFEHNVVLNEKHIQDIVKNFPEEGVRFQNMRDTLKILNNYQSRRVIKTHLPFELLPPDIVEKGCKIIYMCRYPKDASVSYFNLQSNNRVTDFCADFETYWRYFKNGHSMFGPYFEHVNQGFRRIGSKNFIFMFFEEFAKDNRAFIQKLAGFLEIPLNENQLKKMEDYINIDNFRQLKNGKLKNNKNEGITFIRNGKVGGWRNYFTGEMNEDADAWIEMNTRKIGMKYPEQMK